MSDAEIRDVRSIFSVPVFSTWALCGTFPFQTLDLRSITTHHWKIWPCSAMTGENLVSGLDWVVNDVASRLYYSTVTDPSQSTKNVVVNSEWPLSFFFFIPTPFSRIWNGWMHRSSTQETSSFPLAATFRHHLSNCRVPYAHPSICIDMSLERLSPFR